MSLEDEHRSTYRGLKALVATLRRLTHNDADEIVTGIALPVLDAALAQAKALLPGDPVAQAAADAISPETAASGDPVRAADALVVAEQLLARLPVPQVKVVRRSAF